ncbi:MAG TPA: hypothetical protein VGJ77_21560 [Gaiellaceae bacterium]
MRLVAAEILKLRRRRGLMTWSALLTIGTPIVAYSILVALHAASPDRHGPAGGTNNLQALLGLYSILGGLAGILIGTTAGSQDRSSGVFRDLAVTGRPRKALFHGRAPGALAVYLPLLAAGFGIAVAGSYAFAGELATPSGADVGRYAAWILATGVLDVVLGVALASVVSSRIATGVLVAWNAFVAPLLIQIDTLGGARKAISVAAARSFAPAGTDRMQIMMAAGTALLVLAVWIAVALRGAAWWTKRVDA